MRYYRTMYNHEGFEPGMEVKTNTGNQFRLVEIFAIDEDIYFVCMNDDAGVDTISYDEFKKPKATSLIQKDDMLPGLERLVLTAGQVINMLSKEPKDTVIWIKNNVLDEIEPCLSITQGCYPVGTIKPELQGHKRIVYIQ